MNSAEPAALPKEFLRSCLLLLLREQPAHGYELVERTPTLGVGSQDPGGLYRALRKLEQDGMVRSAWERSESGPQRRIYQITRAGGEELHRRSLELAAGAEAIEAFIARYQEFVTLRRGTEPLEPARPR